MSEKIIYDGIDLIATMRTKIQELDSAQSEYQSGGIALAKAEREYKKVLAEWTVRLKDKGYSGAMIEKMIYGIEEVANLRYQRDIAQVLYDSKLERINCTKLEMRILEGQINREYGRYGVV